VGTTEVYSESCGRGLCKYDKIQYCFFDIQRWRSCEHLPAVTLDEYIQERHEHVSEGHISGWKLDFFRSLIQKNPTINLIGEIGFNAGILLNFF